MSNSVLSQVLEALYEAPLNPSRWEDFLQLTAAAVEADAASLLLHDLADTHSIVARHWSRSIQPGQRLEQRPSDLDGWLDAVIQVADREPSASVVSFSELQSLDFFYELLLPFRMQHGIFAIAERTATRLAHLSVQRGADNDPFREADFELIRLLCPHLKQAYRMHSLMAGSRHQRASLRSALDSLAMGVILLASHGQVVTMNRAAERLLANDGLEAAGRRLRATRAEESKRLDQVIEEATGSRADQGLKPPGLLMISRPDRPALLLLVSPVRGLQVDDAHPVRAIVFITDPAQRVRPTQATLRALFGLTPAEYRLAMLLADGQKPAAIAEMIGVSRNTLKSQLAGIYRKTGTSRQAELVGLLLQLPTASPVEAPR